MDQGDESALELGAAPGVDGGRGEGLPDDALADVRGDEQRYSCKECVYDWSKEAEELDREEAEQQEAYKML